MRVWSRGDAFVQRAVVAGLCDPPILKTNGDTVEVLAILDAITGMLASSTDRKHEGFRVLRQALGYGWSVAAAAAPQNATPYLDKWLRSTDKDVAWVMQSNLKKARMADVGRSLTLRPEAKAKAKAKTKATPTPKAKAKPKPKAKPKAKPKRAPAKRARR